MGRSRSEQMSRIRGSNTGPERALRQLLWAHGIRYRLQVKTPAGRADLASRSRRIAVFIDGCFWHGCPKHYVRPRSRERFWAEKLRGNVERDRRQTLAAEAADWTVLRFWEHEVEASPESVLQRIQAAWSGGAARRRPDWRAVSVTALEGSGRLERWELESLRHPQRKRTVLRERSTRKWARRQSSP